MAIKALWAGYGGLHSNDDLYIVRGFFTFLAVQEVPLFTCAHRHHLGL